MQRRKMPLHRAALRLGAGLIAMSLAACQQAPTTTDHPDSTPKAFVITDFTPYAQEVVQALKPAKSFLPIVPNPDGAILKSEAFLDDHGWVPDGELAGRNVYTREFAEDGDVAIQSTSTLWMEGESGTFERQDVVTKHDLAPAGVYVMKGSFPFGYLPAFDFSITYKTSTDAATSRVAQYKRVITRTADHDGAYENTLKGDLPAGGSANLTGVIDDFEGKRSLNGTIVSKDEKAFKVSYESQDQLTDKGFAVIRSYQVELVDRAKLSVELTLSEQDMRVKGTLFNNLGQEIATINEQAVSDMASDYVLTWKDGRTEPLTSQIHQELTQILNLIYDRTSALYD